ncbi:MAG: dihydroflavonol-4-reductase, partial [Flavobacteriales bacterium]
VEIAWRFDAVTAWLLNRKRKLTQAAAVASYSTNTYSNNKIKTAINFTFIDMQEYIKANF